MSSAANLLAGAATGAEGGGGPGEGGAGGGGAAAAGTVALEAVAGAPGAGGDTWYSVLSDKLPDGAPADALHDRAWAENKGFAGVPDVITAYRNLERSIGAKGVPLPKDDAPPEAWNAFYKAAGRPDTPADYKLTEVVPTANPEFVAAFGEAAHPLGVTAKQAAELAKWYAGQEAAAADVEAKAFERQAAADTAALRTEWGDNFKANASLAGRAAKAFGFDAAKIEAIEKSLGTGGTMRFMLDLAKKIGEDGFEGGNAGKLGGMTMESAADAKKAFLADADQVAKLHAKDPAAVAKWKQIADAMAAGIDAAAGG